MGSTHHIFTCLDSMDPAERVSVLSDVLDWLCTLEVVAPAPIQIDQDEAEPVWRGGARWREAIAAEFADVANSWRYPATAFPDVEISFDPIVYSAMENSEDPTCANCGAILDSDLSSSSDAVDLTGQPVPNPRPGPYTYDYGDLMEQWLSSGEPSVRCVECGWIAPLGDWATEYWPGIVGAPALTLQDWPGLSPAFRRAVLDHLGRRAIYIQAHI